MKNSRYKNETSQVQYGDLHDELCGKKILFITTKNLDYIRNVQEINVIKKQSSSYKIVGSFSKSYLKRICDVYIRLLLLNISNFDMVFIGFAPQLILPIFIFKFKHKKIVIDFFISLFDTFVDDRKKVAENSLIAKILKKVDYITLRYADLIISDTKAHGNYFERELGADRKKILTLYLEADKSIYYPRKQKKIKKIENKFVVLYFGSILPLQGIDVVLEAYDILKRDERFYFYMIGKIGDKYKRPESLNIEYIDWLSQEELAKYIAMADLCLAGHFNKQIGKARRTIPGKAYIYASMQKRIILGDSEANKELFLETKDTYFVPMGEPQALAQKITEIYRESRELNDEKIVLDFIESTV